MTTLYGCRETNSTGFDVDDICQVPGYPCSIRGQSDIYGLGIRVGLYVQWYCTTLAYIYDPKEATNFTIANYCFSIAVAVASIVHRAEIYNHEVMIIAVLLMLPPTIIVVTALDHLVRFIRPTREEPVQVGQTRDGPTQESFKPDGPVQESFKPDGPVQESFRPDGPVQESFRPDGSVRDESIRDESIRDESIAETPKPYTFMKWLRDCIGMLSTAFLLSVSVWELFDGVKDGKDAPGCLPEFIKSFYINGQYELGVKVIAIMFAVLGPMFHICLMIRRILSQQGVRQDEVDPQLRPPRPHRVHSFDSISMPFRSTHRVLGIFKVRSCVALLWGMVASFVVAKIETIIKQNEIQDMMDPLSAGQLIPLIVGFLQFCIVTFHFMNKAKESKNARLNSRRDKAAVGHLEK